MRLKALATVASMLRIGLPVRGETIALLVLFFGATTQLEVLAAPPTQVPFSAAEAEEAQRLAAEAREAAERMRTLDRVVERAREEFARFPADLERDRRRSLARDRSRVLEGFVELAGELQEIHDLARTSTLDKDFRRALERASREGADEVRRIGDTLFRGWEEPAREVAPVVPEAAFPDRLARSLALFRETRTRTLDLINGDVLDVGGSLQLRSDLELMEALLRSLSEAGVSSGDLPLQLESIRLRLETRAAFDPRYNPARMLWAAASVDGSSSRVRQLIADGVDVNVRDVRGRTALYLASQNGRERNVRILLEGGATPDLPSDEGITALMIAALEGHEDIVRVLLDWGSDVDRSTPNGVTSLMAAAQEGQRDVIERLLTSGAGLERTSRTGTTALWIAAAQGRADAVQVLLEHGAQVDAAAANGVTPLIAASQLGHRDVVKRLLDAGANIHRRADVGLTALEVAREYGHEGIARMLEEVGAVE